MLSLLSACSLAVDLARHPAGARLADAVDRVLALTTDDLAALDAASGRGREREAARQVVLAAARETPTVDRLAGQARAALEAGAPAERTSGAVDALVAGMLLRLDDLLALIGTQGPLAQHPRRPDADGTQAALDAVTAAWVGAGSAPAVLGAARVLAEPWAAAMAPWGPPLPERSWTVRVGQVLDEVGQVDAAGWDLVAAAHRAARGALRWSVDLHAACTAVLERGDVVAVARAQVAGARSVRLSGVSTGPHARAAAMSVAAVLQAECAADVLEAGTTARLRAAWEARGEGTALPA